MKRIATRVLEDLQQVINSKFEEKKTELATRQDVNDLRVELINKLNDHFKLTIAAFLSVAAFIVALIKLL